MTTAFGAAIFDMDGTIVDNMRQHARAWVATAEQLGVQLTMDVFEQKLAGRKNEEIVPLLANRTLTAEEVTRIANEKEALYRTFYAPEMQPMPGLIELLARLRNAGVRCVVASSAPRENRTFVLDGLHLASAFEHVIGAEDVHHGKPSPDLFLLAATKLDCPPERCIVFEDAINGVLAARNAGMDAVGVTTTTSEENLRNAGARWVIRDFKDLAGDLEAALFRTHAD